MFAEGPIVRRISLMNSSPCCGENIALPPVVASAVAWANIPHRNVRHPYGCAFYAGQRLRCCALLVINAAILPRLFRRHLHGRVEALGAELGVPLIKIMRKRRRRLMMTKATIHQQMNMNQTMAAAIGAVEAGTSSEIAMRLVMWLGIDWDREKPKIRCARVGKEVIISIVLWYVVAEGNKTINQKLITYTNKNNKKSTTKHQHQNSDNI
jgi:hypothetical protein